ncbi:hypothetical protein BLNAU_16026 [Blattamonas nauphoetae]|uniref:Uncharacterized protein n=1 Tax=Blattamonas nauphoetae TaxID=2049346 RepID=A0ABQ9X8W2_9EUKA|nr:hypothetical protein BLNAU_16026 [Blattamonas nauphoetae]
MEPSLAQPFNYFGGYPQNGRGEMGNRDRQRDLMTELLDLKRDNSMGTFLLTHQPTVLMNNPLRSDLLSYMQTEADEFGNIFALLNGHLHEHDVDRILYTSSSTNKGKMTRASPELNVPAFSHSHSFRLFTIDHGILEYSDHQHRPISRFTDKPSQDPLTYVTVLNPPSSEHMTSRTQWHLVQNSTHIRVMVYTQFKNPHVRAVIVPGHVPYAHVTADGIFPFMFAPEPIPNAVWFDLHKTTAPNPNDLPLYVAPWNSTQFRSSRFYTLYVTVAEDSDAHFKYSSSDLVSKPVLFNKNSSVFFTTKPHPFSVSGFTKTPRVSLLRTGVQLPLTQWTRLIILTLSIILITTLLLSRFVPLFAYCLSLSKDRYLRKESRKQLTTPDAEHNANSLVVPPAHKDSFRTRYLTAIADVISEPTPFLVASDFNPKAKSPFVSRRSRMAAFLHLDALLPDSYYLLPHSFATKVDRFRRRMKMVRKVRKELKQAKQNAKQAAIPQDEMGDMPFTPSSPVPEQGPQLNASPTRGITLSVPLPNFPDRLLQWLVLQLYPYYRLPIAGLLIIVAVIFVFASFPIIRGNPLPPLLPVRLFIFKNQQGTMSNHAIDTAQLMWMVYLGFSVFPLIVFVAHTGASRAPPIAPSDKRPFNIYRRLVLPLFLGWNELLPVYRTRSAIPTPLLLVYWISGYAFSIVIIKFIAPLGASFLLSLLAIPSIAITAVLHAASIVGYLQSKKLDSPRSES